MAMKRIRDMAHCQHEFPSRMPRTGPRSIYLTFLPCVEAKPDHSVESSDNDTISAAIIFYECTL